MRSYLPTLALFLTAASASPFQRRDLQWSLEWSFDLFPTIQCNQTGDLHTGIGSTGCRADLHSVASAYRLNQVSEGCQIEFFDNTMCDATETTSDITGPSANTGECQIPAFTRRYGSYQVTCDGMGELR
ncbi:hypothetical protein N7493_005874 [Penicillium malachiteum]|uniref:Uncharacterized protein n=1 Tax=Penicillium malachiteum TaxID=1324776 RepID=A0AAD6HLI4_9EURO|nr:hypothetical protein N7493_005874 [Penicillium malachiteum]